MLGVVFYSVNFRLVTKFFSWNFLHHLIAIANLSSNLKRFITCDLRGV